MTLFYCCFLLFIVKTTTSIQLKTTSTAVGFDRFMTVHTPPHPTPPTTTHRNSTPGQKQGGILAGNRGARLPRNFQTHTKSLQQITLFWPEFYFMVFLYILSNEGILPITYNMQEIFPGQRKKYLGTVSNELSQEEISCCKQESFSKDRNFLSQEEISCHRKKFLVTGRNFLSQSDVLSQEGISCQS